MSVRIIPARSGKGFEYDIRFRWPEGGRLRERGKCPTTGKDGSRRWAEARERAIAVSGKDSYRPLSERIAPAPAAKASAVPTFKEFWPRVLTDWYGAERKKASTVDAARLIYQKHLSPAFDTKPLHLITSADVSALKGSLSERGPKTVNNVLSVLSRALRCAVEWDVIPALPCKFGLLRTPAPERNWYELPEYRRLVAAAEKCGTSVLLLVLLAGSAGLRRGEIMALKWTDVDLERRQIRVLRAIWRNVEDTPKGGRGRVVPLTDELVTALKAHRPSTGLRERVLYPEAPGASFVGRAQVRTWMKRAQRLAGLEANGGIHLLRHTFCSHLAIAGVPANAIQALAGHTDLKTTMRYLHLSPSHSRDAVDALSGMYAGAKAEGKERAG